MTTNNKSNKSSKPDNQVDVTITTNIPDDNTGTAGIEIQSDTDINSQPDVNLSTDQQPVVTDTDTADSSSSNLTDQPTELQQLVDTEIKELETEINTLKGQIKEKTKRIRDLQKKPNAAGTTKKEQAEKWLYQHPTAKLIDFINYAVGELDISPVYANTVYKQSQKLPAKNP